MHEKMDGSLTCSPADVPHCYLLSHDELSGGGRRVGVFRLFSINLLLGLLELLSLLLNLFQQLRVVCEGVLERALAQDTTVGTDVDYEVCDRADHCDIVSLQIKHQVLVRSGPILTFLPPRRRSVPERDRR